MTDPTPITDPTIAVSPTEIFDETPNAVRLVARFGQDLCYCQERKAYFAWNGRRWVCDDFRQVETMAEETIRQDLARAEQIQNVKARDTAIRAITKSMNRVPLQSMIHLAKKKVRSVSINEFDADPWVLNCQNGIVDLKTGELLPHNRSALCSKMIPVDFDPHAECSLFMRFLTRIMGGGDDAPVSQQEIAFQLIGCLQRLFGCGATGRFEKTLAVLFGVGNNGKTTLLEVIRTALGGNEYAGEIQINTLMMGNAESSGSNAMGADIADLKGCRLVTSSEPEEGHRLSVNRVKYLTGGNQIKARYLRENHFTFQPSHTIFLDTNHPPVITNAHDAVWNRVKCIPFNVTIPKEEVDPELPQKLHAELPGILAWIVQGATIYANFGLYFPPVVNLATEEYRNKSDHFPAFISDVCVLESGMFTPYTQLRREYEAWATSCGEDKLSPGLFVDRLKQAGFKSDRKWVPESKQQVRGWIGIGVKKIVRPVSLCPADAR